MNWKALPDNGIDAPLHVDQIQTREDLVAFLGRLRCDLRDRPKAWENSDLAAFLEALRAWVDDMDGYYRNQGKKPPDQPTWQTVAEMLMAASVYE